MALATKQVHQFSEAYAFGLDKPQTEGFAKNLQSEVGYKVHACATAEEAVRAADVIYTSTPASKGALSVFPIKYT